MRRSRSPHSLLSAKRRRVRRESLAVAQRLRQAGQPGHPGNLSTDVHQLRATLHGLRQDMLRSGEPGAKPAAEALGQLDTTLAKLVEAGRHADPNAALTVLGEGMRAFHAARAAVKAAGHAWPL